MYSEDNYIMLSALQHYAFCPRQCALIHLEDAWNENVFTAEGRAMHERVHDDERESRRGVKIERGMLLESKKYGLKGKADVVEFYAGEKGKLVPFPVEYKRGKPKPDNRDKVQLCAQALCLEEMTEEPVKKGALFYGKTRRRLEVSFDQALRRETIEMVSKLREMLRSGITPKAKYSSKCRSCSLNDLCMPKIASRSKSVKKYVKEMVKESCENT
ncbi:MAG: CRISPR-associated protein Cas4 [Candidatus Margulisiibacteriota bacterium]|nr:CRISPR-associated protein Cas4 [Candidatus Margulisiibacteriota bacterium]